MGCISKREVWSLLEFKRIIKCIQVEKGTAVARIWSDHGGEFENAQFEKFCDKYGIHHEFSAPKTPQQNGVAERKNRVLQDIATVMLHSKNLPRDLCAEAVNTACYIINSVYFRAGKDQTAYELWHDKRPNITYFKAFGCKCYILRDREQLGKFDSKSDEGVFISYSTNSCAYRVLNLRTGAIQESINVVIDDQLNDSSSQVNPDNDGVNINTVKSTEPTPRSEQSPTPNNLIEVKDHPKDQILGDPLIGVKTRNQLENLMSHLCFTSKFEPQ